MKSPMEIEQVFVDAIDLVNEQEENDRKVLLLADLRNVPMTYEMSQKMNEVSDVISPHIDKSAVLGITGIKRLFFNIYTYLSNENIQVFDTKEEALVYLVS